MFHLKLLKNNFFLFFVRQFHFGSDFLMLLKLVNSCDELPVTVQELRILPSTFYVKHGGVSRWIILIPSTKGLGWPLYVN